MYLASSMSITTNQTSTSQRALPTMPTLESLPRELRQHIFFYAFEEAAASDIKFQDNLSDCLWDNVRNCSKLIESYEMPECLKQALQHDQVEADWEEDEEQESSPSSKEATYAPCLSGLASTLCLVFPGLRDDVVFVLEKTMKRTYAEDGSIIIERKGAWSFCWDAIEEYGTRAEEKWYTHDNGNGVWILAREDETSWKRVSPDEMRMVKGQKLNDDRDTKVVDWLYVASSVYSTSHYGLAPVDGYYGPRLRQ